MSDTTPVAIVLAAGKGERIGGDRPKQLLELGDRPVLVHALDQHVRLGHRLVVVVSTASRPLVEYWAEQSAGVAPIVVEGGATRRASVLAGIDGIPADTSADAPVLLRNAASPNVPDHVVIDCAAGVADTDGVQAFVPSEATTFERRGDRLERVLVRADTGFTCDPTAYRRELVDRIAAELRASDEGETTLDIARRLGAVIGLVESPVGNIKITTPGDLEAVRELMGYSAGTDNAG